MKKKISILLSIVCFFGLFSCGIRPIKRPDNNISGVDMTQIEETDKPVSIPPETLIGFNTEPPESYAREWYPGMSNGTGGNGLVLSYLSDEKYIAEHTLGYFYIQNKRLGLYVASETAVKGYYDDSWVFVGDLVMLAEKNNAYILQLIELEDGYYAFLDPERFVDDLDRDYRIALTSYTNTWLDMTIIDYLWHQSYIIKKTDSGAYTIGTRYNDRYHYGYIWSLKLVPNSTLYWVYFAPYTPDDDYSDEWLFIPAEPPETTAP